MKIADRSVILLYGAWIVGRFDSFAEAEEHRQKLIDEFYDPNGFVWSVPA